MRAEASREARLPKASAGCCFQWHKNLSMEGLPFNLRGLAIWPLGIHHPDGSALVHSQCVLWEKNFTATLRLD